MPTWRPLANPEIATIIADRLVGTGYNQPIGHANETSFPARIRTGNRHCAGVHRISRSRWR